MSKTRVFVTGVTGYIAGDAIHAIYKEHPDFEYAALVRTKEKGELVKKAFPSMRLVFGGLDDSELLQEESSKADIVLHAADASDHEGAAKAIATGLAASHTKERPGYWLHTGGTGILTYFDSKADRYGEGSEKVFNDWEGVDELTTLPDEAFHRNVDKIVLEAGTKHADCVKTALICPPTIYGLGRGPCSGRGRQAYELTRVVLSLAKTPILGAGKTRWNNVHVADLSTLYLLLFNAAASGNTDSALWGAQGYYFAENGEHVWAELAVAIADKAVELGYIKGGEKYVMGVEEAKEQAGFEALSWGLNSRAKAVRAGKVLGWRPERGSIEEEIPEMLKTESEKLKEGSK